MISFHDSSYFPSTPNVSGCFWWHQKNTIPNFNEFSSGEKVSTEKSTAFHRQKFTGLDPQIEAVDEGAFDKVSWGWWMFFGSSPCVVFVFRLQSDSCLPATPQEKWQNSCPTCQNMYLINLWTHLQPTRSVLLWSKYTDVAWHLRMWNCQISHWPYIRCLESNVASSTYF